MDDGTLRRAKSGEQAEAADEHDIAEDGCSELTSGVVHVVSVELGDNRGVRRRTTTDAGGLFKQVSGPT